MAKRNVTEQFVYSAKVAVDNSMNDPVIMEMLRRFKFSKNSVSVAIIELRESEQKPGKLKKVVEID